MREIRALCVLCLLGLVAAAPPPHGSVTPAEEEHAPALEALRRYETERRAATDFAALAPSDETQGADPYRIAPLPRTGGFVGLLRGRNALVVLDENLREVERITTPEFPVGLAVHGDRVMVAGGRSKTIGVWRFDAAGKLVRLDDTPERSDVYPVGFFAADLAAGPSGTAYALDATEPLLWDVADPARGGALAGIGAESLPLPWNAERLARAGRFLVLQSLAGHSLTVFPLDAYGLASEDARTIRHDGPFWCFHAVEDGTGLLVAAGGVENKPLDRSGGFFGNIDSFVYLYRVPGTGEPELLAAVNVSELGVVTPKGIHLERDGTGTRVTVAGAGGFVLATLTWPGEPRGAPAVRVRPIPAGSADLARAPDGWVIANPLLDAWVRVTADTFRVVEVPSLPRRDSLSRLGEALFTTVLMSPRNTSDGARSRFTCETCHLEGGIDGRVHWTGRDSVFASTRPLRGLFNDKPYFSRALDPDLATMVHNEFRVAGAASGADPWFPLRPAEYPGLDLLGRLPEVVSPDTLRLALMRYLMDLTPRVNPLILYPTDDPEAYGLGLGRGAVVFRDRCAGCHRPRLVTDDPGTEVAFPEWESLIVSAADPIVWASEEIHRTGVKPYVREDGSRVPSLRRVGFKHPYFTNGSARTLGEVLDRARWVGGTFFHDGAPPGLPAERLSDWERTCLLAFLRFL